MMSLANRLNNPNHITRLLEEELTAGTSFYSRYDNPFDGDNPDGFLSYSSTSSSKRDREMATQFGYQSHHSVSQSFGGSGVPNSSSSTYSSSAVDIQRTSHSPMTPSPTFQLDAVHFLERFNLNRSTQDIKEGLIIGEFILGPILGMGAFSVVREAFHVRDPHQRIAVKVIDKSSCDKEFLETVKNEVSVWRTLDHPNIIKFIDQVETSAAMLIFCELAEQGPLYDFVAESPNGFLRENDAKRIFSQIISALEYLHCRGVLHGDIKLDNVLLDKEYNVKLCDFGLCQTLFNSNLNLTLSSDKLYEVMNSSVVPDGVSVGGTLLYSAPEVIQQATKKVSVGFKSDIWSAGVTLYAIVFGQMPFDDCFEPRLKHSILTGVFTFPDDSDVSDSCKDLIKGMLSVCPNSRFSTLQVSQHDWLI